MRRVFTVPKRFKSVFAVPNIPNLSFEHVNAANDAKTRRTKVICTLGPACWSVDGLVNLIDAGMNIARFNFSHGDHKGHFATLERLREALSRRPDASVGVMLGKS